MPKMTMNTMQAMPAISQFAAYSQEGWTKCMTTLPIIMDQPIRSMVSYFIKRRVGYTV